MSTADEELRALAALHGVYTEYFDLQGHQRVASPDTLRALLNALGVQAGSAQNVRASLAHDHEETQKRHLPPEHIVVAGQPGDLGLRAACEWVIIDETGSVAADGRADALLHLPELATGYYDFRANFGGQAEVMRLLVRPATTPTLQAKTGQARCWGLTGALYGMRSDSNGGLGNYNDLKTAVASLGSQGAQFFGINPVHALGWATTQIISPYSPSHRGFLNADHIATPAGLGATPADPMVDYSRFRTVHRKALEQDYQGFEKEADPAAFETWRAAAGSELSQFTQFEALSEIHGADFRDWPQTLQSPGSAAAKAAGKRTKFHAWLQWQAETQITAAQNAARGAGMSLGLYLDLAVGPRPDGAEVWMNAQTIAKGVTIGAPPDHLSPEGQSWALAAHAPGPLAGANYAPFRAMLRKLMAECGLLRIDHALGLARSYWLPDDGSPGGYITQPFESLLAVIQIEAARAGCVVIGEDLGLVPAGFRERMNAAGLYSYAVWQFEAQHDGQILPVNHLAPYGLACFGTHDTPTISGFWHGTDIEWWHRVGWLDGADRAARHGQRARQRNGLRKLCNLSSNARARDISDNIHTQLAKAPSELVSVQLDDALGITEAQNLPGTIDEHPNWRRRLTIAVEDFAASKALLHVADMMNTARPPISPRTKEEVPS